MAGPTVGAVVGTVVAAWVMIMARPNDSPGATAISTHGVGGQFQTAAASG